MTAWGDVVGGVLLGGPDPDACLMLGDQPLSRRDLRRLVREQQQVLAAAGLRPGAGVAIWLPPSVGYVATLLAAWRLGGQAILLDHRLTPYEVDRAVQSLAPLVVVKPATRPDAPLRGFVDVAPVVASHPGRPVASEHVLVQLSSGSSGPSKVVGRTGEELLAELERYARIPGMPGTGQRVVVLSSLVHAFGLIGGLLHALHVGATTALVERMTVESIRSSLGPQPTTTLGVPFHYELLSAVTSAAPRPTRLVAAVAGGELIRPGVPDAFAARYGVPLGECYGMTEMGVIAMDMSGAHRPASGPPAPGIELRVHGGELLVARPTTPYLGHTDPARWRDGWLYTRDAARLDPSSGALQILGRLDSQVSIGGLKVDLSEVEHTVASLPGVVEAIVVYDRLVEAFLALRPETSVAELEQALAVRLAPYKRPRRLHVLPRLPRTATGKRVRDLAALRAAADEARLPGSRLAG